MQSLDWTTGLTTYKMSGLAGQLHLFSRLGEREREKYVWTLWRGFLYQAQECRRFKPDCSVYLKNVTSAFQLYKVCILVCL